MLFSYNTIPFCPMRLERLQRDIMFAASDNVDGENDENSSRLQSARTMSTPTGSGMQSEAESDATRLPEKKSKRNKPTVPQITLDRRANPEDSTEERPSTGSIYDDGFRRPDPPNASPDGHSPNSVSLLGSASNSSPTGNSPRMSGKNSPRKNLVLGLVPRLDLGSALRASSGSRTGTPGRYSGTPGRLTGGRMRQKPSSARAGMLSRSLNPAAGSTTIGSTRNSYGHSLPTSSREQPLATSLPALTPGTLTNKENLPAKEDSVSFLKGQEWERLNDLAKSLGETFILSDLSSLIKNKEEMLVQEHVFTEITRDKRASSVDSFGIDTSRTQNQEPSSARRSLPWLSARFMDSARRTDTPNSKVSTQQMFSRLSVARTHLLLLLEVVTRKAFDDDEIKNVASLTFPATSLWAMLSGAQGQVPGVGVKGKLPCHFDNEVCPRYDETVIPYKSTEQKEILMEVLRETQHDGGEGISERGVRAVWSLLRMHGEIVDSPLLGVTPDEDNKPSRPDLFLERCITHMNECLNDLNEQQPTQHSPNKKTGYTHRLAFQCHLLAEYLYRCRATELLEPFNQLTRVILGVKHYLNSKEVAVKDVMVLWGSYLHLLGLFLRAAIYNSPSTNSIAKFVLHDIMEFHLIEENRRFCDKGLYTLVEYFIDRGGHGVLEEAHCQTFGFVQILFDFLRACCNENKATTVFNPLDSARNHRLAQQFPARGSSIQEQHGIVVPYHLPVAAQDPPEDLLASDEVNADEIEEILFFFDRIFAVNLADGKFKERYEDKQDEARRFRGKMASVENKGKLFVTSSKTEVSTGMCARALVRCEVALLQVPHVFSPYANPGCVEDYIRRHFFAFLQLYYHPEWARHNVLLCRLHLRALLAIAWNRCEIASDKFKQMRIVEFLAGEIDLEHYAERMHENLFVLKQFNSDGTPRSPLVSHRDPVLPSVGEHAEFNPPQFDLLRLDTSSTGSLSPSPVRQPMVPKLKFRGLPAGGMGFGFQEVDDIGLPVAEQIVEEEPSKENEEEISIATSSSDLTSEGEVDEEHEKPRVPSIDLGKAGSSTFGFMGFDDRKIEKAVLSPSKINMDEISIATSSSDEDRSASQSPDFQAQAAPPPPAGLPPAVQNGNDFDQTTSTLGPLPPPPSKPVPKSPVALNLMKRVGSDQSIHSFSPGPRSTSPPSPAILSRKGSADEMPVSKLGKMPGPPKGLPLVNMNMLEVPLAKVEGFDLSLQVSPGRDGQVLTKMQAKVPSPRRRNESPRAMLARGTPRSPRREALGVPHVASGMSLGGMSGRSNQALPGQILSNRGIAQGIPRTQIPADSMITPRDGALSARGLASGPVRATHTALPPPVPALSLDRLPDGTRLDGGDTMRTAQSVSARDAHSGYPNRSNRQVASARDVVNPLSGRAPLSGRHITPRTRPSGLAAGTPWTGVSGTRDPEITVNLVYHQGKKVRRMYDDENLHCLFVLLILALMQTPKRQVLDNRHNDQFPTDNHKVNLPFLLSTHLNHFSNINVLDKIVSLTQAPNSDIPPATFRIIKMLSKHYLHQWLYTGFRQVGKGQFGYVWKADTPIPHSGGEMSVAIKHINLSRSMYDRSVFFDAFNEVAAMDECRKAPGVCELLDYGVDKNSYWIIMRCYEQSLHSWRTETIPQQLKDRTIDFELAVQLMFDAFRQICLGVQSLHSRGVVHYDLKMQNCIVNVLPNGRLEVALADFGESRIMDDLKTDRWCRDRNRGTECIKSPEMLRMHNDLKVGLSSFDRRKTHGTTSASDIWSLGCLLYELLSGNWMFAADDAMWAQMFHEVCEDGVELFTEQRKQGLDVLDKLGKAYKKARWNNIQLGDSIQVNNKNLFVTEKKSDYMRIQTFDGKVSKITIAEFDKFTITKEVLKRDQVIAFLKQSFFIRDADRRPGIHGVINAFKSVYQPQDESSRPGQTDILKLPKPPSIPPRPASSMAKREMPMTIGNPTLPSLVRIWSDCTVLTVPFCNSTAFTSDVEPVSSRLSRVNNWLSEDNWTHVLDTRGKGAITLNYSKRCIVTKMNWGNDQRSCRRLQGLLPMVFDVLRRVAASKGKLLIVDGDDDHSQEGGGIAFPMIVFVVAEAMQVDYLDALCALNGQVLLKCLRRDMVLGLAEYQRNERRVVWEKMRECVRVACLCGSVCFRIPTDLYRQQKIIKNESRSSNAMSRILSSGKNLSRDDVLKSTTPFTPSQDYEQFFERYYGKSIDSLIWLPIRTPAKAINTLTTSIIPDDLDPSTLATSTTSELSKGPASNSVICGITRDNNGRSTTQYACTCCGVLTHSVVTEGSSTYLCVVMNYEMLRDRTKILSQTSSTEGRNHDDEPNNPWTGVGKGPLHLTRSLSLADYVLPHAVSIKSKAHPTKLPSIPSSPTSSVRIAVKSRSTPTGGGMLRMNSIFSNEK